MRILRNLLLAIGLIGLSTPAFGAIAFDSFAKNEANGTGDFSISLVPVGTLKGVIVYVVTNAAGDEISSVNINGTVSLTETASSPALNTAGEDGGSHCFFVGSGIPSGTLTINVVTSGTATTKIGYAVGVTADQDTSVVTTGSVISNSVSNPSTTLSLGGVSSFVMLAAWSGIGNLTMSPATGWTERSEFDFGNQNGLCHTYDTVGTTDVAATYTQSSDDVAMHAIAVRENAAPGGASAAQIF